MRSRPTSTVAALTLALATAPVAFGQLRVGQWNITNFPSFAGDRQASFKTSLYGVFEGRSFAPDVLIVEEIVEGSTGGQVGVNQFLGYLNTAPGSPGDWAAAPYVFNAGDTGNALFYRTSKVQHLSTLTLNANTGSGSTQAPRDNQRWRVRLVGYTGNDGSTAHGAEIYLYGAHFKAGSTGTDQTRRLPEAQRIRENANALPDGSNFILGADFNVQNSAQTAYQYLVSTNSSLPFWANASGQFLDPINTPGSWENSSSFRFVHTQEPGTQMDSRHDQLLISAALRNGQGLDYMPAVVGGNILLPYSTSTWNDSNHSYRSWGNDGDTFNTPILANANTMVGPTIAQALVDTTAGGGHLPVFLDLRIPAKLAATPNPLAFGTVPQGATAQIVLQVSNAADLARFTRDGSGNGFDALTYTLSVSGSGFSLPGGPGPFNDPVTIGANSHLVALDTASPGPRSGTLTITSDDPDAPTRVIALSAIVGANADYDVNDDGSIDIGDLYDWFGLFTDVNANGTVDGFDLAALRDELRRGEIADITHNRR